MFDRVIHADWSITSGKRWMAVADRVAGGWLVQVPALVHFPADGLLDEAFAAASDRQCVLLGFDFPIGVPAAYGAKTGLGNFRSLLDELSQGPWSQFFEVAREPSDIAVTRPFYPAVSKKGVSRSDLVAGLGASSFDDLLRICERRTAHRRAACALFWTLGGNQVGKGALSGWREVVLPAIRRGGSLWPFAGRLAQLANAPGVVIAETYPAEAYRVVGADFLPGQSKRRQTDRRTKSDAVVAWAKRHSVAFTEEASEALADGFGAKSNGEDQFDAALGLLKMIEVVDGRRREGPETSSEQAAWEGWILGS